MGHTKNPSVSQISCGGQGIVYREKRGSVGTTSYQAQGLDREGCARSCVRRRHIEDVEEWAKNTLVEGGGEG